MSLAVASASSAREAKARAPVERVLGRLMVEVEGNQFRKRGKASV